MFREFSFYFFLLLLPTPFIFFFPIAVLLYIVLVFALLFYFSRQRIFPLFFLLITLLLSSAFHYKNTVKLEKYIGNAVEVRGIVLKQKNTKFNSTLEVFVPVLQTRKEKNLSYFRVFVVKTPCFYRDLTGRVVRITAIISKSKVYKNSHSSNYCYLLSANKLFFLKVKDKVFIEPLHRINLLNLNNIFLKEIKDIQVKRFLSALIFGKKESLDYNFTKKVKKLGIYHLFVLSGFHFGIFSFVLWLLLFPLPLRKRYKKVIILILLTFFLFLTSFSPPSIRVYLMLLVYFVFDLSGIDLEPLHAIGIAGMIMLLINPFNSFNPGFLMSFFASAGIVIGVKEKGVLYSFFLIPFVAFFVMLPFYLYFFNYIPFLAPFYNILIIPFVVFLFWFFVLNIVFGGFFSGFLQGYVLKLVSFLNSLPAIYKEVFPSNIVLIFSISIVLFFFLRKKIKPFTFLSFAVLLMSFIILPPSKKDFACFFDSKAPQCVLINQDGANILVNTGDSYFSSVILKKELGFMGIKKIDAVLIEKLTDRSLDKLERIAGNVKIEAIVVSKKDLKPYKFYRLKWICGFYKIPELLLLTNGEKLELKNKISISFSLNTLIVKAGNKAICFGKDFSKCEKCDFVVLKKVKKGEIKNSKGEIIICQHCDLQKDNVYSTERDGEICIPLKLK